ncbi:hypothetical protein QL285_026027 [Trifolium repens]|nr:hypothetical protein QL285_026027 [Trifolium repens]
MLQVLNQDEASLLHSFVFGERVLPQSVWLKRIVSVSLLDQTNNEENILVTKFFLQVCLDYGALNCLQYLRVPKIVCGMVRDPMTA